MLLPYVWSHIEKQGWGNKSQGLFAECLSIRVPLNGLSPNYIARERSEAMSVPMQLTFFFMWDKLDLNHLHNLLTRLISLETGVLFGSVAPRKAQLSSSQVNLVPNWHSGKPNFVCSCNNIKSKSRHYVNITQEAKYSI